MMYSTKIRPTDPIPYISKKRANEVLMLTYLSSRKQEFHANDPKGQRRAEKNYILDVTKTLAKTLGRRMNVRRTVRDKI